MFRSWLIIGGRSVPIRATTRLAVRRAALAAVRRGQPVSAAYLGRFPTALAPRVWPATE